jgi:hypothetical protein
VFLNNQIMLGKDIKVLLPDGTATMPTRKNSQCFHYCAVNVDCVESMNTGDGKVTVTADERPKFLETKNRTQNP